MRNLPFGRPIIGNEERSAVASVLAGDILVHGPLAPEFEGDFNKFTGSSYSVSVSSCTAALHLCYFYYGLGTNDEVIVPAQTHTATAHAVELTGAKPVFVDAESVTGNIDIDQIEDAISPRTRAISLVHYLGMPVNMDRICSIAKKHNLHVIEDCALALGTYFKGKHAGLWGDAGCFSFYPVKHMTTSEGGMITTQNEPMYKKISRQKAFGVDRTVSERSVPGVYDVTMLGFNYRMSELEAAIGIAQIKKLNSFLEARKRNYSTLENEVKSLDGIRLLRSSHGDYVSSLYCLSIILNERMAAKRFELVNFLKERGIGTSVYYPKPVPHMSYYKEKYGYAPSSFPNASEISYRSIALSVGPHLNEDDMLYIGKNFKDALYSISK